VPPVVFCLLSSRSWHIRTVAGRIEDLERSGICIDHCQSFSVNPSALFPLAISDGRLNKSLIASRDISAESGDGALESRNGILNNVTEKLSFHFIASILNFPLSRNLFLSSDCCRNFRFNRANPVNQLIEREAPVIHDVGIEGVRYGKQRIIAHWFSRWATDGTYIHTLAQPWPNAVREKPGVEFSVESGYDVTRSKNRHGERATFAIGRIASHCLGYAEMPPERDGFTEWQRWALRSIGNDCG
jgi:hypothetical protein